MRKLVYLGLLALSFGFLSNAAFAGNVDECDYLKDKEFNPEHPEYVYTPGLYGLCIAWHNADEKAKGKLADKFAYRAGFEVPGSVVPPAEQPEEDRFYCPCWDEVSYEDICSLGIPVSTLLPPDSLAGDVIFADFISFNAEGFGSEGTGGLCGHFVQNLLSNETISLDNDNETPLTENEAFDCRAELEVIASLNLHPICNP